MHHHSSNEDAVLMNRVHITMIWLLPGYDDEGLAGWKTILAPSNITDYYLATVLFLCLC